MYLKNMYGNAKAIKEKGKLINEKDFKDITGIIGLDVSNWSDATGIFLYGMAKRYFMNQKIIWPTPKF